MQTIASPQLPAVDLTGRARLLELARRGGSALGRHDDVGGNAVRLIVDNAQLRPKLLEDIRSARSVINAQEFIWTGDGLGRDVADALKAKAREGVQVNVQLDGTGSSGFPFGLHPAMSSGRYRAFVADMREAGVNVVENWRYGKQVAAGAAPSWDHRKLFSFDGRVGYVGGINLSGRFEDWHDTMARVEGPAVAQVDAEFLGRWRDIGGAISPEQARAVSDAGLGARLAGTATARVITNSPGARRDLTESYLDDIRHSTRRLWVTSPSVASPELVTALQVAAKRGVDVRLVLPSFASRDGDPVTRSITGSYVDELVESGVRVYEHPRTVHAKVLLSDDTATVGSFNLNTRSQSKDLEAGLRVHDDAFRGDVEQLFDAAFHDARPVDRSEGLAPLRQAVRGVRELFGLRF
ncbi:MAG: cardiolipin synthase [Thermoleophilia bacterium]|nr:cardiolipin synthase [Thermoleophilia bacterium]